MAEHNQQVFLYCSLGVSKPAHNDAPKFTSTPLVIDPYACLLLACATLLVERRARFLAVSQLAECGSQPQSATRLHCCEKRKYVLCMDHSDKRFGYGAGTQMQSFRQLLEEAEWAQSAGFESFWLSQVFGLDPIVALPALGDRVPQFRELGTSVVPLAGRHPLALGAQARTAQSALDGRFTLGIGTSHQAVVEGFFGESYKGVFGRTEQFLNALLPLLDGKPCDVDGGQVFAKGWLTIEAEPVPTLLAALGPKMLELAGRLTAGTSVANCGPKTISTHVAPRIVKQPSGPVDLRRASLLWSRSA
jgi:Luciferase-like monooxygenase